MEPEVIRALYEASGAGVYVDLIVRGICCLRPGIPGVSENIRVRSIVGRFLEHSRVYYFHNGGNEELYCASADWMERNFFRRIELMFPISDAGLKARVMADLDTYLADNVQAWELRKDGRYEQLRADRRPRRRRRRSRSCCASSPKRPSRRAAAREPELEAARAQPLGLLLQIGSGQRIVVEPVAAGTSARESPCPSRARSRGRSDGLRLRFSSVASRSNTTSLNIGARHELGSSSRNGSSSLRRCNVTRLATSCCSSRTKPGRSEFAIK